ncbi:MAG: hypothetical protein KKI02_01550, partial [Planctomycetes bacterium]|nr:hypothetical protein [Planctomycetota bacterium]
GFFAGQASDGSPAVTHPIAASAFGEIVGEINADRTMIVCFTNWSIQSAGYTSIPGSGEGEASYAVDFYVFSRGEDDPWDNDEEWNYDDSGEGLGHAVTAVGYLLANDSLNPEPGTDWVIVHDNVSQTPRNVAVPLTAGTFGDWVANTNANRVSINCPGDLDGDGDVDLADLAQLLSNYGTTEGATYEQGDLDGDGDVDLADLAALLAVYGQTCAPPLGACCVDVECVGTIDEGECVALGGQWFEGEDCFGDPPFECDPGGSEDTLLIRILTDSYASETTWDLYEQGGGLIASGAPGENNTLYEWEILVEPDQCYDFTIYDSYGDGICCAYGEGYYEIELNGELVAANYNFHGYEDTVAVGGGCESILGACCVDGACVGTVTFGECGAMSGEWYLGEDCFGEPPFECLAGLENDDCHNAMPIMEVLDLPFDTTEATFDGEGQCMYSPNIWYCFTAMVDGMVYVATCGSGYDTMLAVYDGCSCDPLPPIMECNDDSCGLQSEIMFPAIAGQEYLIEVGGYGSQSGPGVLTVMHQ